MLVALRKESVDRNNIRSIGEKTASRSLSARRAWIEIQLVLWVLRKVPLSLSARRAWIEIGMLDNWKDAQNGRSPQGERG